MNLLKQTLLKLKIQTLRYVTIPIFFAFILLSYPHSAFAIMYQPGQTLNPTCFPTASNCGVVPPLVLSQSTSTVTATAAAFVATSSSPSTFPYASTTAISVSGGNTSTSALTLGTLSGIMKAVNGVVETALVNLTSDITGVLSVIHGGTGTATVPTYGKVLLGNSSGTYDLVATSSLGISSSGGGTPGGSSNQIQVNSNGAFGASPSLTFNSNTLSVQGTASSTNLAVANNANVKGALTAAALTVSATTTTQGLSSTFANLITSTITNLTSSIAKFASATITNLTGTNATLYTASVGALTATSSLSAGSTTLGNTTITNNNTLTVGTGLTTLGGSATIAGTLNVTGTTTLNNLTMNSTRITDLAAPIGINDAANKAYVDAIAQGISWQQPVVALSTTTAPTSPTTGDRYVLLSGASSFGSCALNQIAQYSGSAWTCSTPSTGWSVYVNQVATNYNFNGTAWVSLGSTINHDNLFGLQGGQAGQYYHLNLADYNNVHNAKSQLASLLTTGAPSFVGVNVSATTTTQGLSATFANLITSTITNLTSSIAKLASATITNLTGTNATLYTANVGALTASSSLAVSGNTTLANATVTGHTTLTNASSTNQTVSGYLNVAGKTTLSNASTTELSVSGPAYFNSSTTFNGIEYLFPTSDGTANQVLRTNSKGGLSWSTVASSGGGYFATTTNSLIIHPTNTSYVTVLGASATTTTGNILEVKGNSLFGGDAAVSGHTTLAAASSTNQTVSGYLNVGGHTTLINASTTALTVSATTTTQGLTSTFAHLITSTITNLTSSIAKLASATITNLTGTNATLYTASVGTLTATSSLAVNGQTTLGNASSTNQTVSGYLNVGGQTTLSNASTTELSVSGPAYFNGQTTLNGVTAKGSIIPSVNSVYSLGDATHQWKSLYISSTTIYVAGIPLSNNAGALTWGGSSLDVGGFSVSGNSATSTGKLSAASLSISGKSSLASLAVANNANVSGALTAASATVSATTTTQGLTSTFAHLITSTITNLTSSIAKLASATITNLTGTNATLYTASVGALTATSSLSAGSTTLGNTTITGNNTLTVGTGLTSLGGSATIAGTLNVTGTTTLNNLTMNSTRITDLAAPIGINDAANKAYVDAIAQGISWQQPVVALATTTAPASPTTGDRYVLLSGATSFGSCTLNQIAQYSGTAWTCSTPSTGWSVYVNQVATNYNFNGTAWVSLGSTINHDNLFGLQGGQAGQYYHLNLADYNNVHNAKSQLASLLTTGAPSFAGVNVSATTTTQGLSSTFAHLITSTITNLTSSIANLASATITTLTGTNATLYTANVGALTATSSLVVTGNTTLATTAITGHTTLSTASSTNQTVSGYLNVAGQTTLGNASTTNQSLSGYLNISGQTTLGNASTTALTVSGNQWITPLATPAGTFLAVNAKGQVIATSTPAVGGSGTVTSVALTVPTGLAITGSPITSNGTLALALASGYTIPLTASTTNWNSTYNTVTANSTNWNTAYTNRITSASLPLSIANNALSISQASSTANGYLSSTDFNTFNNKQSALAFTYPLINIANTVSTAFSTTTANSYNKLQQFNANASTTALTVSATTTTQGLSSTFASLITSTITNLTGTNATLYTASVGALTATSSLSAGNTTLGNTTITNNNTLTVGTGLTSLGGSATIAGTLNVTGTTTLNNLTMNSTRITDLAAPIGINDAANKAYVDAIAQGISWQQPVVALSTTTAPTSPTTGDRYVILSGATSFGTCTLNQIAQYSGSAWTCSTPSTGWSVYVNQVATNYNFNGTAWVSLGSTINHNNLFGLQGGQAGQYYHLNLSDYNNIHNAKSQLASLLTTGAPSFVGVNVSATTTTQGLSSTFAHLITSTITNLTSSIAKLASATITNLTGTNATLYTASVGALTATSSLAVNGHTTLTNASTTALSVSGPAYFNGQTTLTNASTTNQSLSGYLNVFGQTALVNASTTALTVSGNQWITPLATPAGTFLAVNANGEVIATSTPASGISTGTKGQLAFYNTNGNNLTATSSIFLGQSGTFTASAIAAINSLSVGQKISTTTVYKATGKFNPKVDYTTGSFPNFVAIGDLNGDGKPDLAVANYSSNTVSVFINNGNGTFAPKVDYTTGTGPFSVAIADLNGDGNPDLAVANIGSSTVSILLNNGNGTFAPKVDYTTGNGPAYVAIADLNGDGKPDLAVANLYSNNVSILLNNGNGTFATVVNYTTGSYSYSVAIGDLNGDGKPDLAVTNESSNTVSILLNNGNGTFATKVDYTTGTNPISVAIGDLNGDGKLDLAVANYSSNTVSVFLNNGNGTFASKADYTTGTGPSSVAIADLNGDGKPDLAVANYNSNTVSILLNNGNGTFASKVDYATGSFPNFVAIGDLNGDGKPDLAVANYSSNTISILTNIPTSSIATTVISAALTVNGATGKVGIGIINPTSKLDVNGDINVTKGSAYKYNGSNVVIASTTLSNYFFGSAGNSTMTGSSNTASGVNALSTNTTGSNSTANGVNALYYNSSATSSVAVGYASAQGASNYHNKGGVYLGYQSGLNSGTNSDYNTFLGYNSGNGVTTGARNILIGASVYAASQNQLTTGSNNISIGYNAILPSVASSNQLNIGNTIYGNTSVHMVGIGTTSPLSTLDVFGNLTLSGANRYLNFGTTSVSSLSGYGFRDNDGMLQFKNSGGSWLNFSAGGAFSSSGSNVYISNTAFNLGVGTTSPKYKLDVSGFINTDKYSGYKQDGKTILYTSSTNSSTLVGQGAGAVMSSAGSNNTAVGKTSLNKNTTGSNNTAVGVSALFGNTTGSSNVANGVYSLFANTTGSSNTAVGRLALFSNTGGSNNVASGYAALNFNTTGSENVGYGFSALASNNTGSNNTAVGFNAGAYVRGNNNTILGGNLIQFASSTASNQLNIGNIIYGTNIDGTRKTISTGGIGIGITNPTYKLDVKGDINVSKGSAYKYNGSSVIIASTTLNNYFFGGAGNLTMTGTFNTANGVSALNNNTTGSNNTANGMFALLNNNTGSNNTANGYIALNNNTTGYQNTANGVSALQSNTTGTNNTANGYAALNNNTLGSSNTSNGIGALYFNTTGSGNTASGANSGNYITGGAIQNNTSSNSTYLGYNTKALVSGDTNETVIGYNATGIGSNSVMLGNSSVIITALNGKVGIGTTSPIRKLVVAGGDVKIVASGSVGAAIQLRKTGTLNGWSEWQQTGTATRLNNGNLGGNVLNILNTSGNIGIGNSAPAQKLVVNGGIQAKAGLPGGSNVNGTGYSFSSPGDTDGGMFSDADGTLKFLTNSVTAMTIDSSQKVGIGTPSPVSTLDVVGSGCFSIGSGASATCGQSPGNIYYTAANSGNYDVAEKYRTYDKSLSAGDVITLDTAHALSVVIATSSDVSFIGVVSTAPGVLLGGSDGSVASTTVPVALSGRVPVKISLANGPIAIGDRLTVSSTTPGVAVRFFGNGSYFGQALQPYTHTTASSTIEAFINPGTYFYANKSVGVPMTVGVPSLAADALGGTSSSPLISSIVSSIKNITIQIAGFAQSITTKVLTATMVHTNVLNATTTHTKELCVGDTCINQSQLKALLKKAGQTADVSVPAQTSTGNSSGSNKSKNVTGNKKGSDTTGNNATNAATSTLSSIAAASTTPTVSSTTPKSSKKQKKVGSTTPATSASSTNKNQKDATTTSSGTTHASKKQKHPHGTSGGSKTSTKTKSDVTTKSGDSSTNNSSGTTNTSSTNKPANNKNVSGSTGSENNSGSGTDIKNSSTQTNKKQKTSTFDIMKLSIASTSPTQ